MKYRLEYSASQTGAPAWGFYGDFPTRAQANDAGRTLRRQFGRDTKLRITLVAQDAPEPAATQKSRPAGAP